MTTDTMSGEGLYYTDLEAVHYHGRRAQASAAAAAPRPTRQAGSTSAPLMSIRAMNWAWGRALPPTAKLVLMSLADAADDEGVCWPSVPMLARKCCVSTRTERRILQQLIDDGLLRAEPCFRKDGSRAANRYTLALEGGDKMSRAPEMGVTAPGQRCPGPPDNDVTPRTTKGTVMEPPRPPPPAAPAALAASAVAEGGGGHPLALEYPKSLSEAERAAAYKRLETLPAELAQQLLDELASYLERGSIRGPPLAYLRALLVRAQAGTFAPEGGPASGSAPRTPAADRGRLAPG